MDAFEKLKEIFGHFPGIGPRQAERFAYYLLGRDQNYLEELKSHLTTLKKDVTQCVDCMRFFAKKNNLSVCSICANMGRDNSVLMLVAKDNDLITIEKSGVFNGKYFILGGLVPILEKVPEKRVRLNQLKSKIENNKNLTEVILALSATHEGENTGDIIEKIIKEIDPKIKVSRLGRGLSTGLEIEYSDTDTIKEALKNKSTN
jgi:recombination protein RecR